MVDAIGIAVSGLAAAGEKARTAASNIANMGTVGALDPADGPAPYAPQDIVQKTDAGGGVLTSQVARDPAFSPAYDPNSPFANEQGIVGAPNVDLATEAMTLKQAELAYKASAAVIRTAEKMQDELLKSVDKKI